MRNPGTAARRFAIRMKERRTVVAFNHRHGAAGLQHALQRLERGLRQARDQLEMALGGLNWASVSFAVLYGVVSIAFTLWCLAWVRRRWPTSAAP